MFVAKRLEGRVPIPGEFSLSANVSEISLGEAQLGNQRGLAKLFDDVVSVVIGHDSYMTNNLSFVKTRDGTYCTNVNRSNVACMDTRDKTFGDIAERLRWHRNLEGLTQNAYAKKIGVKRAALNNWEGGDYRLSLDGALALRRTYGLSLDFMFEGNDDALPMTLRQAWRERP